MKKNKLWFRRKTYGWGWTPITWEGWLVTFLVVIIPLVIRFTAKFFELERSVQYFLAWSSVPILVVALIVICLRYGERPKWQWGVKRTKLSHIDLNVSNYLRSIEFYDLILLTLGWEKLVSRKDHTSYSDGTLKIILSPVEEKYLQNKFHRKNVGINHLAFYAETKEAVDEFYREVLQKNQIETLYEKGPSGDKEYYSVFFEDPDRLKIEVVYSPFYCDKEFKWNNLENDL